MKTSIIFVISFYCTLYVSERSTAMKLNNGENTDIIPTGDPPDAILEANAKPDIPELEREDSNIPDTSDMQREDKSEPNSPELNREEIFDMQKEDSFEPNNPVVLGEDNFEPHTSDMQQEDNPGPNTSDVQRKGGKKSKSTAIRNCLDLKKQGKRSGSYLINPCDDTPTKQVMVYCDMVTDGGGWTVIQRRGNYPEQENFYNTWFEYMIGFGDVMKDFWLGNDNIHCLSKQSRNEIRFDLEDWSGATAYANYDFFYIDDQANKYKLEVQNYTGNAGDSFSYHNNMYFSTLDADNDAWSSHCAASYNKGGWWYRSCHHCNPNGQYNGTGNYRVMWYHWKGWSYSLKKTEMKIRGNN